MHRPTRTALLALALVALLAGCGSQKASQGSVRDQVKEALLASPAHTELSDEEAGAAADCVARGMFESGDFTPDERDAATSAVDGDAPDPDLVTKVEDLVDRCIAGDEDGDAAGSGEG